MKRKSPLATYWWEIALVVTGTVVSPTHRTFGAQLPIPCVAGSCGITGPATFVSSGKATAVQAGNSLAINQSSDKAVLNWSSFNVSADGKVTFNQPTATSVALNRIFQGNPSSIFGQINANGQIYLVNPNGFIFGSTAKVNASGLIASSLGISDSTFASGLLAPQLLSTNTPALASDGRTSVLDNAGNPVLGPDGKPLPVQIDIVNGAQLSTPGGRLLLAAPTIQNGGSLSASDGQVVLAAGQSVYLQASADPKLRGLVVEVDSGGTAWNELTGQISAPRGNVTMVGLAVNQDGRISATTSVSANGSVRLEAADTHSISGGGGDQAFVLASSVGHTLELGAQSSIDISPELASSATAVPDQPQFKSQIDLLGEQIFMHGGSIHAPSGTLNVTASANPGGGVQTDGNAQARIRVDSGTSIDLSGSDAELPMSANLVAIQLRANELADDPTQRNGALRGQTVYIDSRVGSRIVSQASLAAAVGAIPQSIAQRTTTGGTVNFQSEGDVVFQKGATINVSGGQTTYDSGVIQTSFLAGQDGKLYDIGTANPLLTYKGVVNPTFTQTFNKWGVQNVVPTPGLSNYESGYVQGANAGSVNVAAPSLVLSGTLVGHAVNGALQRNGSVAAGTAAAGGTLTIGLPKGLSTNTQVGIDSLAPSLTLVSQAVPIIVADDAALPVQTVQLPTDYLVAGGFTSTNIYSNGVVTVPAGVPLNLNPGGSMSIQASRINVLSNVTAPGGSVQLQNALTIDAANPTIPRLGIQIGDGVTLDVRGQWTNDSPALAGNAIGTGQILQNGGTINVSAGVLNSELVIGNDAAFRASGGAWLQSNGAISGGSGGKISLQSGTFDAALQVGSGVELDAFGVNGANGGSFSLTAPRLLIADQGPTWASAQRVDDLATSSGVVKPGGFFKIGTSLFNTDGFASVSLTANGPIVANAPNADVLTVQAGTVITPRTETLKLQPGYGFQPTGADIAGFTQITTLPAANRQATSVALSVTPQIQSFEQNLLIAGLLDVQTGASIQSDPRSSITLTGVGGTFVDGTLSAPGGSITLRTPTPISDLDPGYLPNLRIELGAHGVLDVSGTFVPTPNSQGLLLGTVLPGGSVNLLAQRGSVVADPGSQINIAGTSASLDVPTLLAGAAYARHSVPSAAGSLLVQAPESISLLGSFDAKAGVGDYGQPAAGSLEVDLTRSESWFTSPVGPSVTTPLPTGPRIIQLASSTAGMQISSTPNGLAVLGIAELAASGIDSLRLEAGDEILLSTSAPLRLAQQVIFNAPTIGVSQDVSASITTGYASLGNSLPTTSTIVPAPGNSDISVNAQQIDLIGSFVFQNAGSVHLNSSGDITLRGVFHGATQFGALALDGNLVLAAARIYPATDTAFSISTTHNSADPASMVDTVSITQSSASPGTPLSAGGKLSISADQITSSGTLMAPFGQIDLAANSSLTLAPNSVTSVSANGLTIPYGSTQLGGIEWIYTAGGNISTITGIPQRAISLTAPKVNVAAGATINLSGGGDLYAYEWVPGTGGTTDALGQITQGANAGAPTVPGLYAVLPSLRGLYAPFDPQETSASGLTAGASIYLSGGGGLAAGFYPLLPARDALLPGAFLVQVQSGSGYANIVPGEQASLADNTPVVAGYLTFGNTGLHSGGYQGVAIWPGSYGQQLSQYNISNASTYFAAAAKSAGQPTPALPADAGSLSIGVSDSLNFLGSVIGNLPNSSGLSSRIDIGGISDLLPVALEVTGSNPAPPASGTVTIAGTALQAMKAGELVLGGHPSSDGSTIDVTANSVTIDSGAQVSADQVIVVANQTIDLQSGAAVLSTSATAGGKAPATLPTATPIALTGPNTAGAALLAVSDLALPIVQRAAASSGGGVITVEHGAALSSLGALSLDGPGGVGLAGTLSGVGASWSLASGSIGFVGTGTSADALQINSALQSQLQAANSVRLASEGNIDLYTAVSLGVQSGASTPTLSTLTLSAASLVNQGGASGSVFGAKTLTLQGASGAAQTIAVTPGSTLSLVAGELDIGPGTMAIAGFSDTSMQAGNAIVGRGTGGLATGGNLTITAPLLTAVNGAHTQINAASGALTINAPAAAATPPVIAGDLGGELDLFADSIKQTGLISVPAGIINMQATHDINLGATAMVDAGGHTVTVANHTVGAEGGAVTIAAGGNLSLASGSRINVSGAGDAPAGSIALSATGSADLLAALTGHAGTGAQGGSFSVDAGALTEGLTPLSAALQSGGFTAVDSVRARTGDLTLSAGGQLAANQVTVTADAGTVDIAGTITAANAGLRGDIGLFGGLGVTVAGQLHADTVGGAGVGGNIELGSSNGGQITLGNGSLISATGSSANGQLLIRAPIVGNDVALMNSGANLAGLGQIIVEPVMTMPISSTPTAADFSAIKTSITNFMNNAEPVITARLNPGGALPLVVRPAVDLEQNGSLTLSSSLSTALDLDKNNWRFDGQPVDLTFRVGGSITVGANISDGFMVSTPRAGKPSAITALDSGPSASIRFVAGADATSANPLSVVSGSNADLMIGTPGAAKPTTVRTGTGEIDLVASGNVVFEAPPGATAGSSVYTAGVPGAATPPTPIRGTTNSKFFFPTQGGDIRVSAGGDVQGADVSQSVTAWQIRQGNPAAATPVPTQWGVDLNQFGWNVGSLGGGDVAVTAHGNINNLSAAAADSYANTSLAIGTPAYFASGGLAVTAGGDIGSSQFYLAQGQSLLRAGGGLTAIRTTPNSPTPIGSLIALGDAQISVEARTGIIIDEVMNPTGVSQVATNPYGDLASYFYTYGDNSKLLLQSTSGDISLVGDTQHQAALAGQVVSSGPGFSGPGVGQIYPSSLIARSLQEDISLTFGALFPSNNGQLELVAARDVIGGGALIVSDAAAAAVATPQLPSAGDPTPVIAIPFTGDRHVDDPQPALVLAGRDLNDLTLYVPKAADIVAGRDISNLAFFGQNLNPNDLTLISAGRDVIDAGQSTFGIGANVVEGGPGQLDVLAGRNVDLGFSHGITTIGNLNNANLPTATGADLTVLAGLGQAADFTDFLSKIIAPDPTNQALLVAYVQSLTGQSGLSFAQAETAFSAFNVDQQRPLIDQVFFDQLLISGRQANTDPKAGFSLGYAAIDALFPNSRTASATGPSPFQGNISLTFSSIYTTNGGTISLLAPGGTVDVGLANPPASLVGNRSAAQLGIVAQGPGDVDIYTKGDVNVNSSRIFTLGGGNILIWSDEGSIDAGKGAKTSVSAPPPRILVDSSGNVTLDFSQSAVGSGIRTIQVTPSITPGNVDLIAPQGTVNAGDAGIGAAGNINIAALHVIGLDNIQFGGNSTGVPAQVSNLGASLSGVSNTASSATNSSTGAAAAAAAEKEAAAPLAQTALSWLDVFVTGLGEENCKQDDMECLKRQKTGPR